MKRIIYLIGIVIGLCLTSACSKNFLDQVLLEGTWGLTRFEMITTAGGSVIEDLITDCDPYYPKSAQDTKLSIVNGSGNTYVATEEYWDNLRGRWVPGLQTTYIVRDDVMFILENGREMEYGRFQCTASTLTITSTSVDVILGSTTTSISTYRRMSGEY